MDNNQQRDVEEIKGQLTSLQASVEKIEDALLGDEYHIGFKQRIEKIEREMPVFRKGVWVAIGFLSAVSIGSGIVVLIKNILEIGG